MIHYERLKGSLLYLPIEKWQKRTEHPWRDVCRMNHDTITKGGLISKKGAKSEPWGLSISREDAQGRDLAPFFWDLSQSDFFSEIKVPLTQPLIQFSACLKSPPCDGQQRRIWTLKLNRQ